MGNKKKNQKKPVKKKTLEAGCIEKSEAGLSQTPEKSYAAEKQRQTRNKASMKMFEHNSSFGQSTPDPFSDDGEYGSDDNYDPGYDDDPDRNSSVSVTANRKNTQERKDNTLSQEEPNSEREKGSTSESDADTESSDEDTEDSADDDSEYDANSISSNESIFETRKRSYPDTSKTGTLSEPKSKKPKVPSADESTDSLSLESEVLLSNVGNLNFESSLLLPDPTELESISIHTHIEDTHAPSTSRMLVTVAAEGDSSTLATTSLLDPADISVDNRVPINSLTSNLETAEENNVPASSFLPLDPQASVENHASSSSPAVDPEVIEGDHVISNSPSPDPEAPERNNAPANSPGPDLEAAESNHAPTNSPTSDPDAAEKNHAFANSSALDPETVEVVHRPANIPELNPVSATTNPVPSSSLALDTVLGNGIYTSAGFHNQT